MESNMTMETDPNLSTEFLSIEINVGDSVNHTIPVSLIDDHNDEEKRHFDTLFMTCRQLQTKHHMSQLSEATTNTDAPSMELLGPTVDGTLKSLVRIWSTAPSSSSKSVLHTGNAQYGKVIVSDHDIEVMISSFLTIWDYSVDVLRTDVQNSNTNVTSIIVSTLQLLSRAMRHQRWKHELLHQRIEKFIRLLARTASFFLLAQQSDMSKKTKDHNSEEEKKSDDHCIHDENITIGHSIKNPEKRVTDALFQLTKDIANISADGNTSKNATNSDYMIVVYEEIYPILCDRSITSKNVTFMIDISSILWRWASSQLARCMAHNTMIWNAIKSMWLDSSRCIEIENQQICVRETVLRSLAAVVGMLVSSVASHEIKSSEVSSSSTSSPQSNSSEQEESISMIEAQDWLIPMLLECIRSTDSNSKEHIDCKRRCLRTLRSTISTTWGKSFVYRYVKHKNLATILLQVIDSTNQIDTNATRALACDVVGIILRDGCSEIQLAPYIETSLVETIIGSYCDDDAVDNNNTPQFSTARNNLVLSACQALSASLQYSPWNRSAGLFTEVMFKEILYVLRNKIDQSSYHTCISNLFLQLVAYEKSSSMDAIQKESKTTRIKDICSVLASYSTVLEIFSILLSPNATKSEFDVPRSHAIQIIVIVMENDNQANTIKKQMATDEHLLTALVNVCLVMNTSVSPLKDDAKRTIMTLIPEI